jgi:hypothetical protein
MKNTPKDTALKVFRGFTIKDADKGEVAADVCTLGVVDKDGDIVRRGALAGKAPVVMSAWGHDAMYGQRPAGKGTLVESGNRLHFEGRVFLNTTGGRETFEVLKEMGEDQEWSFGFRVTGWEEPSEDERKAGAWRVITKMDAFEVSPVLIGAGVDTGTTRIKAAAQADGASDDEPPAPPAPDAALIAAIAKEVTDRMAAEQKAAADAAAEAARVEAETKAAAEAKALQEAREAESAAAAREFETFQRTMRRVA